MSPARLTLHAVISPQALMDLLSEAMEGRSTVVASPQLRAICEYLGARGVTSVIWQRDVQDPDFTAEHAAYYARWSFPVPRFCTRLHFFSALPPFEDTLGAIDHWAETGGAYLGFLTLRPLAQSPVGATFLRVPDPFRDQAFVHASHQFRVNLAGRRFHVLATPFMQQDNAVGACAQAAIWMGLRTLRWREGRSAYNPAQITSSATRFVVNGRTLPNRQGLRIEQITEAVRAAGYAPHVLPLRTPEDIRKHPTLQKAAEDRICRQLYPYVESGIPVLLALMAPGGGHAVVVIGHGWRQSKVGESASGHASRGLSFVDASWWARPFLIHNDNTGPYLKLPTQSQAGEYALAQAAWALPLLSADILVDGEEARAAFQNLFKQLFGRLAHAADSQIVMRVRLQTRAVFREDALRNMPHDLRDYMRMKWLPAYVWVAVFYEDAGYALAPENGARQLALMVLEPNADPKAGHFLCAVAYTALLPPSAAGMLVFDRDPFTGRIQGLVV